MEYKCKICGKTEESSHWINGKELLEKEHCFECNYWLSLHEGDITHRKDHKYVIANGVHYIIEPEDFSVRKYPKRVKILTEGDVTRKHVPCVDVEETENGSVNVDISFKPYHSKAEFTFDTDMTVEHIATSNARSIRIMVNDTLYYTDKAFSIKDGDAVTVKVVPVDVDKETIVRLIGVNRNVVYPKGYVPENVYDDRRHENIIIE